MAVQSDNQLHISYHFPRHLRRPSAQSLAFSSAASSPPASPSDCKATACQDSGHRGQGGKAVTPGSLPGTLSLRAAGTQAGRELWADGVEHFSESSHPSALGRGLQPSFLAVTGRGPRPAGRSFRGAFGLQSRCGRAEKALRGRALGFHGTAGRCAGRGHCRGRCIRSSMFCNNWAGVFLIP